METAETMEYLMPEGKEDQNQNKNVAELLNRCIQLTELARKLKNELDAVNFELQPIKERIKDLFIELGVRSMKGRKTVHLQKQLWAGAAEGISNAQVSKALEKLNMESYVTFNHQSLSAYVRELVRNSPDLLGDDGEITASAQEILSILPEPLNTILQVTEKIDVRVKN